jgi:hypothetical protein
LPRFQALFFLCKDGQPCYGLVESNGVSAPLHAHEERLLIQERYVMTQQSQPNQQQQGKPGQPNQMPNKPGQGTQQSGSGQQDQSANKK